MGRLIAFVLGIGVLAWVAWHALGRTTGGPGESGRSAPAQRLDNVREATQRIEQDSQQRADELMKRSTPEPTEQVGR
jgi:hypothetical protein